MAFDAKYLISKPRSIIRPTSQPDSQSGCHRCRFLNFDGRVRCNSGSCPDTGRSLGHIGDEEKVFEAKYGINLSDYYQIDMVKGLRKKPGKRMKSLFT